MDQSVIKILFFLHLLVVIKDSIDAEKIDFKEVDEINS